MRKVKSINDVNMGDVLLYKNLLGIVSYFSDGDIVILETIVKVEIMTPDGMMTLEPGSDHAVNALDCHLVLTRNAMDKPHIDIMHD